MINTVTIFYYFFLSKIGLKAPKVRFVKNYADKWDGVDLLITACPMALESKPLLTTKLKGGNTKKYRFKIKSFISL